MGLEENLDGARVRVQRDWDYNLRAARRQWLKYLDSKLLVHCVHLEYKRAHRRRVRLAPEEMVCNYKTHSEIVPHWRCDLVR